MPKQIKRVFAIGNGESRKSIDLNELRPHGITYGCNALYRDFQPDALVCVDPRMKSEVWLTDYLMENKGYFKEWTNTVPISSYPDTEILPSQPGVLDSPKKVINSDNIIISAHGNSIRAIVMDIFNLIRNYFEVFQKQISSYRPNHFSVRIRYFILSLKTSFFSTSPRFNNQGFSTLYLIVAGELSSESKVMRSR